MDATTLETYRQRLFERQQQIIKRIFDLEEDLHAVGDAEREIERADRIQAEASEEILKKLDEQSRRQIDAIRAALNRIEAGTYGRCETCGKEINSARLEALPMARRCIRCQERAERS